MTPLYPNVPSYLVCSCGKYPCPLYGYCHCECGQKTWVPEWNWGSVGWYKNQPVMFCRKHRRRYERAQALLADDAVPFKIDGRPCRLIELTKGYHMIVDAISYRALARFKWSASTCPDGRVYACRAPRKWAGETKLITMHTTLLMVEKGKTVDHKSGVTLDNREINLRPATKQHQVWNKKKQCYSTSPFKGVRKNHCGPNWSSSIRVNGVSDHLGTTATPEESARNYDRAALYYFGEFARLNFPRSDYADTSTEPPASGRNRRNRPATPSGERGHS